jgi:molybdopterin synthase sulfur carrier subunit
MPIKVIAFGKVASITGASLDVNEAVADTNQLRLVLQQQYPALDKLTYAVAVGKKWTLDNTELHDGVTVALLPPFSGG